MRARDVQPGQCSHSRGLWQCREMVSRLLALEGEGRCSPGWKKTKAKDIVECAARNRMAPHYQELPGLDCTEMEKPES